MKNKSVLAIIPAKGGSKGLPNKNVMPLQGIPLIVRALQVAEACPLVNTISVTTDCSQIAQVVEDYGVKVPWLRPEGLANDEAKMMDVVKHCMEQNKKHDYVLLLQPTSPFRRTEDINAAFDVLCNGSYDSLISFCKTKTNPWWMVSRKADGTFESVMGDIRQQYYQRQKLPELFEYNGAIYIGQWDNILQNGTFKTDQTCLFEMSRKHSIDIDSEDDWHYAEWLMERDLNKDSAE